MDQRDQVDLEERRIRRKISQWKIFWLAIGRMVSRPVQKTVYNPARIACLSTFRWLVKPYVIYAWLSLIVIVCNVEMLIIEGDDYHTWTPHEINPATLRVAGIDTDPSLLMACWRSQTYSGRIFSNQMPSVQGEVDRQRILKLGNNLAILIFVTFCRSIEPIILLALVMRSRFDLHPVQNSGEISENR